MTKISGQYTGKINWQTNVSLPHLTNHQLALSEGRGILDTSDKIWNGAVQTHWSMHHIIGDEGTSQIYYTVTTKDGDTAWGRAESKTSTSGGQVKTEGTFKDDGGNGKFKGIKRKGTFKGHMISPTEFRLDWDGEYEI
jgi:hypothetical protein